MLDGQVLGGSAHMMGHALMEESLYDEKARVLNDTWRDYKQPTSMDVPLESAVEHIHTHDPYGPFGAKGAGEASSCSTLAAIANGIYDACRGSNQGSADHAREDSSGLEGTATVP
jgi:CO/xanthine dehydrogenase Mo-binding subunit